MLSKKNQSAKNRAKGNKGEALTQRMFDLAPTSSSGSGRYDKLDSKNDHLRVETKVTGADHYVLKLEDWQRWRGQAAKDRKTFFLHLIHENEDESLDEENSRVVIPEAYWDAIKPPEVEMECIGQDFEVIKGDPIAWGQEWIDLGAKSVKIDLSTPAYFMSGGVDWIDICYYSGETVSLVAVPATYFKERINGTS